MSVDHFSEFEVASKPSHAHIVNECVCVCVCPQQRLLFRIILSHEKQITWHSWLHDPILCFCVFTFFFLPQLILFLYFLSSQLVCFFSFRCCRLICLFWTHLLLHPEVTEWELSGKSAYIFLPSKWKCLTNQIYYSDDEHEHSHRDECIRAGFVQKLIS